MALLVGTSVGDETGLDSALQRHGYGRLLRADSLAQAIERHGRMSLDLLILPLDELDDAELGSIDRTIWRDRSLKIIATGAAADSQLMLRAMRAGIHEFLVRPISTQEFTGAVERMHRRTETGDSKGQVFAVYSAKGGVGVSTVAVNLASCLASMHTSERVVLADFAVPGGDISILLNLRPAYSLADIAQKIEQLDDELLNSVLVPARDGLFVLAASERPEASEDIDAKVISSVVTRLRAAFEYSVLDCEHQMNDRTLAALDAADRILLLTELQVPAMRSTQRTLAVFRRLGYPPDKVAVVVNRHRSGDVVSASEAESVLKEEIFFKVPNDYKVVSDAGTSGVPVEILDPYSALTLSYRQLAQQLAGGTIPVAEVPASSNGSRSRIRGLFARKRG